MMTGLAAWTLSALAWCAGLGLGYRLGYRHGRETSAVEAASAEALLAGVAEPSGPLAGFTRREIRRANREHLVTDEPLAGRGEAIQLGGFLEPATDDAEVARMFGLELPEGRP